MDMKRFFLLLILCLPFLPAGAGTRTVLFGAPELADRLLSALSGNAAFEFYERNEVDRLLAEHRLDASKAGSGALMRLFPHAELFAIIGPDRAFFYDASGRRLVQLRLREKTAERVKQLKDALLLADEKRRTHTGRTLSLTSTSVGLDNREKEKREAFLFELEQTLTALPGVQLLERDRLEALVNEHGIAGRTSAVSGSVLQLRLEFRAGATNPQDIDLSLRILDAQERELLRKLFPNCLGRSNLELVSAVCHTLAASGDTPADPRREAAECFRQYQRNKGLEYAMRKAPLEAAVALSPDDLFYRREYLQLLFEPLKDRLEWSLATKFALESGAFRCRTPEERSERLKQEKARLADLHSRCREIAERMLALFREMERKHPVPARMQLDTLRNFLPLADERRYPELCRELPDECVARSVAAARQLYPLFHPRMAICDRFLAELPEHPQIVALAHELIQEQNRSLANRQDAEYRFPQPELMSRFRKTRLRRFWSELPEERILELKRRTDAPKLQSVAAYMEFMKSAECRPEDTASVAAAYRKASAALDTPAGKPYLGKIRHYLKTVLPQALPAEKPQEKSEISILLSDLQAKEEPDAQAARLAAAIPVLLANRSKPQVDGFIRFERHDWLKRASRGTYPVYAEAVERFMGCRISFPLPFRQGCRLDSVRRDRTALYWLLRTPSETLLQRYAPESDTAPVTLSRVPQNCGLTAVSETRLYVSTSDGLQVHDKRTGALQNVLKDLPHAEFITELDGRLYLFCGGREERLLLSCDFQGKERRVEFSNRRENPEFEIEKQPRWYPGLMMADAPRKRLLLYISDRAPSIGGLYEFIPEKRVLRQLVPIQYDPPFPDGDEIRRHTWGRPERRKRGEKDQLMRFNPETDQFETVPADSIAVFAYESARSLAYAFPGCILIPGSDSEGSWLLRLKPGAQ